MIERRPLAKLGGLDIGWLMAKHHVPIGFGPNARKATLASANPALAAAA